MSAYRLFVARGIRRAIVDAQRVVYNYYDRAPSIAIPTCSRDTLVALHFISTCYETRGTQEIALLIIMTVLSAFIDVSIGMIS
jgi:hypothetical protein